MPVLKLSDNQIAALDEIDEVAMDIHAGRIRGNYCAIISGQFAIILDEKAVKQAQALKTRGLAQEPETKRTKILSTWLKEIDDADGLELLKGTDAVEAMMAMRLTARPAASATAPTPPSTVYGHLPFTASTSANEIFYRYEAFPSSRRLVGKSISPGTFAVPTSERKFVPTGFAAVGRYALPSLFPAVFEHKIEPDALTSFYCGASVPLYGQSGGGVEVCFHSGGNNRTSFGKPNPIPPY